MRSELASEQGVLRAEQQRRRRVAVGVQRLVGVEVQVQDEIGVVVLGVPAVIEDEQLQAGPSSCWNGESRPHLRRRINFPQPFTPFPLFTKFCRL